MGATNLALPRRRFLRLGVAGALVFAVAGGAAWLWRPGVSEGRLTHSGRAVLGAVATAVLEGSLPPGASNLARHLDRVGQVIAGFPKGTQNELAQLLGLLSMAASRLWLTGLAVDWSRASAPQVEAALRRMRSSDNNLHQQAYHALRDLTNAAFYAQPEHWTLMNYPGPTPV